MFLKGECADFPDSWSDRMWGPDDLPNQRTQYELAACGGADLRGLPGQGRNASRSASWSRTSTASTADCR